MKPEKKKARGTTAVRNEKRTIYIVCAALAAVFIIAVVYLAVLILSMALVGRKEACACLCTNLRALVAGALGAILFALVLLLIDVAAASVIGAILVGLLLFFFALLFASSACLIKCLADCRD